MDAGIDIVSDGEEGKPSYATYVKDRLTGFEGDAAACACASRARRATSRSITERRMATTATLLTRPTCNGPIAWKDFAAVERDIDNFKAAVDAAKPVGAFMTAASPGVVVVLPW